MKRTVLLVFSLLLAMSCERGDLYSTFSTKNKVFFSCDTSKSPYNQLSTPGRFLSVRKSDGKLYMVDSDGNKYEETLSEIQNGSFLLGMGGLIIGTPTFNNDDMSIWAFDLGCPECESPDTRLKFDLEGIASCSKCDGSWTLNTSGFSHDGKSRPLYRYPVKMNDGILTVSN